MTNKECIDTIRGFKIRNQNETFFISELHKEGLTWRQVAIVLQTLDKTCKHCFGPLPCGCSFEGE